MTIRGVGLGVAAVAVGLATAPVAEAQSEWGPLPCADSGLALGDGGTCLARRVEGRAANGQSLGYSQQFQFERSTSGQKSHLSLQHATRGGSSAGSFQPYTAAESERDLRRMFASIASRWGRYRGFGDTGYMSFRLGTMSCVAIDHAGEAYAWILRGYVCQSGAIADLDAFVKAALDAIRVGPLSSNRNATGTAIKPMS